MIVRSALVAAVYIGGYAGAASAQATHDHAQTPGEADLGHPVMDRMIVFHAILDEFEGRVSDGPPELRWSGQGWVGTDYDKFWIKTEGFRRADGEWLHALLTHPANLPWAPLNGATPSPGELVALLGASSLCQYVVTGNDANRPCGWVRAAAADLLNGHAYLEAVEGDYLPLARERGLGLLGCYTHALRPNRCMSLWSFASWEQVRDHMESRDHDAAIAAWERRRDSLLEDTEAWLLAAPPAGALRT